MTTRPKQSLELIRQVLGDNYLELDVERLVLEEILESEESHVKMEVTDAQSGKSMTVEGKGSGLVDAIFHALQGRFAQEYQSLNSIEFSGFDVRARFDTKKERAGADAVGEVVLSVRNSEGNVFHFADVSRSVATSATRAVLAACEYFVNAERAFVALYNALGDARERSREDLVARYTQQLAEVVKSTSYAEIIEKIKREEDISGAGKA